MVGVKQSERIRSRPQQSEIEVLNPKCKIMLAVESIPQTEGEKMAEESK
jgi:hypothetical protein